MRAYVGTNDGLFEIDLDAAAPKAGPVGGFRGQEVTALTGDRDGERVWAVTDGRTVRLEEAAGSWLEVARSDRDDLTCLLASSVGLLAGTDEAHLLRLDGDRLVPLDAFEQVRGRNRWYTPWGGPPAVRSLCEDLAGRLHVNVHVGGIPRSLDGGGSWEPTIDIDADVHQVLAHPARPDVVLAAAAVGLVWSQDGGGRWRTEVEGLHAAYARALAVTLHDNGGAGEQDLETVLLSVSTGPGGRRAAVYRAPLADAPGGRLRFARCRRGLPEWFSGNVDTGCLAASGSSAVLGTADGTLYASGDAGGTWREVASGLPPVRAVVFA
jgi:hypothetical protein